MSKKLFSLIALVGGALLTCGISGADTSASLTGSWQMDAGKSQIADGRTVSLAFVQKPTGLKLDGFVVDKAGAKTELHFDCKMDGSDCEFMEGTHKSKVSIWTVAGVTTACKTDGPVGDSVSEWHMKVSPDGSTLTIEVEHVDPAAAAETMIFAKKASD